MLTCLRYMKSRVDAEDALQDAFISIYKDLKNYDPERSQFTTWSNRIVINSCLQKIRKKSVLNVFEDIFEMRNNLSNDPRALSELNLQEMTALIQRMPKGYRTVFNLYVIDGFTHKEISEKLGISIGTSKSQLMRAKNQLQVNLESLKFTLAEYYA